MNITTKKYLLSSLVTFISAVAVVLLAQIDSITVESFKDGAALGILWVAVRAGFKALLEWFIVKQGLK